MNFYPLLGVLPSEETEQIKIVIRRMLRENHPDYNPNDRDKAEITRLVILADKWLLNEQKRVIHDRTFNVFGSQTKSEPHANSQHSNKAGAGSSRREYRTKPPRETTISSSFQGRIHVEITKTRIVQLSLSSRPIRGVFSASSGSNYYALLNRSIGESVELILDGVAVTGVILFLEPPAY